MDRYKYRAAVLICCCLAGCASMGPPGGGPEDREPPRIVAVDPPSGSTGVDPRTRVKFTFSEAMEPKSLEAAIFISPPPEGKPQIKVRGRSVFVRLREPVRSDRTLVITVGSGARDLHGNPLEESFTLALTAGDQIDSCRLSGRVFAPEAVQGMLLGGWKLEGSLRVDPAAKSPELLTQAGVDGGFRLDFIPPGRYFVACWDDRDNDRLYSPGGDRLGLPWVDVEVGADIEGWMELYPALRDTGGARLLVVSAPDNRHVVLRFMGAPHIEPRDLVASINVADTSGVLEVGEAWRQADDSTRLVLYTDVQSAGVEYRLVMPSDTGLYIFSGSSVPDTLPPRVLTSQPTDGARDLPRQPGGWIGFNDAVRIDDVARRFRLTWQDTIAVPLQVWMDEVNIIRWCAEELLPFGAQCRLESDLDGIQDLADNSLSDSVRTVEFTVVDPAEMGSISGTVTGNLMGSVIVAARQVGPRSAELKKAPMNDDSSFTVEMLRSGDYVLWAFGDRDGDGGYDFGELDPFRFAEHFTAGRDTLEVRARWETAGASLHFR